MDEMIKGCRVVGKVGDRRESENMRISGQVNENRQSLTGLSQELPLSSYVIDVIDRFDHE